jgi:hypothetical protein
MTSDKDGRATLRDVFNLQNTMNEKLDKLNEKFGFRMTAIEIKCAKIATTITVVGGIIGFIITHYFSRR